MALRLLRFYPLGLRNLRVEVELDSNHAQSHSKTNWPSPQPQGGPIARHERRNQFIVKVKVVVTFVLAGSFPVPVTVNV